MGLYKMDHTTAKPVASRLRDVYRPFKASSEFAVIYSVERVPGVPSEYGLEQNYPNPFNPRTVVSSQLPVASHVKLVVYDVLGREVGLLVNEGRAAGSYQDSFDGSGLASGVYFYRLTAGSFVQSRKMVLVR